MLIVEEKKIKDEVLKPNNNNARQPNINHNAMWNPFAMNDYYANPAFSLPQQQSRPQQPQMTQAQKDKIQQDRM